MRFQNLSDNEANARSLFWHGRAWKTLLGRSMELEWAHGWWKHLGLTVRFDKEENRVTLHLGIGVASYFLTAQVSSKFLDRLPFGYRRDGQYQGWERSIGVRIFDRAIWFSLWEDDMEWCSSDPAWMRFRIGLDDLAQLIAGPADREHRLVEIRTVFVPMPEGAYEAEATHSRSVVTRKRWPRWPFRTVYDSIRVEVEKGVPVMGKGENSWDCGEDAIFSVGASGTSFEEAIGRFVSVVMRERQKHGTPPNLRVLKVG